MIRINQMKLPIEHSKNDLNKSICKTLKIKQEQLLEFQIVKRSLDARKNREMKYIYAVDARVEDENRILRMLKDPNITQSTNVEYKYVIRGTKSLKHRPVIIGSGPAGLFCAYFLALNGYQPLLIERGERVDQRIQTVEGFWRGEALNLNSNVQFGEGGAGTFSDGKLNTLVKDPYGRIKSVLETFVTFGAPEEITYINKPHIGTDLLRGIVKNMREEIIKHGGEVKFRTKFVDFQTKENQIESIIIETCDSVHEIPKRVEIPCDTLVLAIGHSARDTFELLERKNVNLEQKAFAIGVRIEHEQELISRNQYGDCYQKLPTADYKVTHQCGSGRGVYSFCMCPGGFVVNASSEDKRLVINGMSNHDRGEKNANSAIIVTITPEDFRKYNEIIPNDTPLAGMYFQRYYEALAYEMGKGRIPIQLFGDLLRNKESVTIGHIKPNIKGEYTFGNLRNCLPDFVCDSIIEGITAFDQRIPGFADEEAVLSGVEMRTSSPIRILRDECYESNIIGLYPCGEGAGYAGGITSAAVDGIRVFEAIIQKYKSMK